MEYPLRRADGAFRWFLTRVTATRDRKGRIVGWVGTNTDIDDQRRVATEAQRDRARIERLQGLAAAFSAARTASDVAAVALTQGIRAAGAPRGLVGVLGEGDAVLEIVSMLGFSEEVSSGGGHP